jgi:hypothetical protein
MFFFSCICSGHHIFNLVSDLIMLQRLLSRPALGAFSTTVCTLRSPVMARPLASCLHTATTVSSHIHRDLLTDLRPGLALLQPPRTPMLQLSAGWVFSILSGHSEQCCGTMTFWGWIRIRVRILLFSSLTFPRCHQKNNYLKSFLFITFWRYMYIIFNDKKSKRSHKAVGIKVFPTFIAWW